MHDNSLRTSPDTMASIGIAFTVFNSFMVQYYVDIFHSYVLYIAMLLLGFIAMAISTKGFFVIRMESILLWYFAGIMMAYSLSRNAFDINTFSDLATFFQCVFICSMAGCNLDNFDKSLKVIDVFSIYYAITVWIQLLLPTIYGQFLNLMPENIQSQILTQQANFAFTGFSSNLGFTAGHILAGILLLIAKKGNGIKYFAKIIFLFVTLMLTGKRSSFVFLIVAIFVTYLVSTVGIKKLSRVACIVMSILLMGIILLLFKDTLSRVPVLNRIIETISGLKNGIDITSNRTVIYRHAWQLFKDNPVLGIGWGRFRSTTLGNITWVNTVEVHNIYLQLLCETGIIGFVIMIIPMIVHLIHSYRAYRYEAVCGNMKAWSSVLFYAFAYQVFFLLYGCVENALYDYNFLIMYFFACAIVVAYERKRKQNSIVSN